MNDAEGDGLHVERWGSGPPLVLLHGLGSSTRGWAPRRDRLGAAHSCIAVDLPGHGETSLRPARNFADIVEPVATWLERNGLGTAACIGHSLGGQVALELAGAGNSRVSPRCRPPGSGRGGSAASLLRR